MKHERLSNMILEMCKAVCKLLYTRRWPPFEVRQELVQQRPWRKVQFRALSFEQSCALHCWGEGGGSDMKRPNRISSQQGVGVMTALCSLFQPSPHSHPGDEMDDNTTQSWHFTTFKIVCLAVVKIFPICTNLPIMCALFQPSPNSGDDKDGTGKRQDATPSWHFAELVSCKKSCQGPYIFSEFSIILNEQWEWEWESV